MLKQGRTEAPEAGYLDARPVSTRARVWDPLVRLFHWSLVASFFIAWLSRHSWADVHHWAGYAAAALVLVRIAWGLLGTRYARFTQFVRGPGTTLRYAATMLAGREARYVGHNPAGAVMVLALLAAMLGAALTGWLMTTDAYFGVEWVERLHDLLGNGLLVLVGLHLAGVTLASLRHRENLVGAMISGRKRSPDPGDVA